MVKTKAENAWKEVEDEYLANMKRLQYPKIPVYIGVFVVWIIMIWRYPEHLTFLFHGLGLLVVVIGCSLLYRDMNTAHPIFSSTFNVGSSDPSRPTDSSSVVLFPGALVVRKLFRLQFFFFFGYGALLLILMRLGDFSALSSTRDGFFTEMSLFVTSQGVSPFIVMVPLLATQFSAFFLYIHVINIKSKIERKTFVVWLGSILMISLYLVFAVILIEFDVLYHAAELAREDFKSGEVEESRFFDMFHSVLLLTIPAVFCYLRSLQLLSKRSFFIQKKRENFDDGQ